MATTNIWQQFKSLIPEGARTVVTIVSHLSNGISQARLRDGTDGGDCIGCIGGSWGKGVCAGWGSEGDCAGVGAV